MQIPCLAEDRNRGRPRFDQLAQVRVRLRRVAGEAGGPERGELGVLQLQVARTGEEFAVLRVRPRPSALDVVDAEVIEFLRNDELVVHGERDGFALRAVPEGRVERVNSHLLAARAGESCGTPASFFFFKNVIISRSSRPTVSMGWLRAASRMARNFLRPVLFSLIQSFANWPDWISERIFFISARV